MKLKLITLAVVATLAAPSAFATPTPEAVAGVQKIVLSGTNTADRFIEIGILRMLDSATMKTYRDNSPTYPFQHRAWYGYAKGGIPGVTAGTPILFVKRSTGTFGIGDRADSNSEYGVDPVARASRIRSLDFFTCVAGGTAAGDGGKVYDYFCGTKGVDPGEFNFTNPGVNNGVVSDFGVSDVPPALFKAPYNVYGVYGSVQLTDDALSKLTIKPVSTLMMGIVATNDVPASTVITRADYGNMLMGNIQDWTQIDANLGGNTNVVVCRQANGSATQAAYNWFFNNFPCEAAFAGAKAPASMYGDNASGIVSGSGTQADPFVIDPIAGYTVVNNSTSGDVRRCLKNAQNNIDHLIKADDHKFYKVKFSNSGNPFKAIGVLSGDSYGKESGWTYRNLYGAGTFAPATQTGSAGATGVAPSKANLLTGAWEFAVELTMQYRNAVVTNAQYDNIPPLSGVKKSFAEALIRRSFDPGYTGFHELTTRNVYAALPYDYYPFQSLTYGKHTALGGHEGNMCQPLERRY